MEFFDNVVNKIANAGQSTVRKAKDISEAAKLNVTIVETEKEISELYSQIGYEVCRVYFDDPIPEVAELIGKVKELHRKIEESREQIKAINTAGSCPQCGTRIVKGSAFCSECGYKFPEPSAEPQGSFCTNCGTPIAAGAAFCANCGTKVN